RHQQSCWVSDARTLVATAHREAQSRFVCPSWSGLADQLARHAPAMHFARAVVNAECTHVIEYPHHNGLACHTASAKDLYASVDNAPLGLRAHNLGATRLIVAALTAIQQPCGVPDVQPRRLQVHVIVS